MTGARGLRHDKRFRQRAAEMIGEFPPRHFRDVADEGAVVFRSHDGLLCRLDDERPAIDIDDRSGRKTVGHETENLPRDIIADTDAADR